MAGNYKVPGSSRTKILNLITLNTLPDFKDTVGIFCTSRFCGSWKKYYLLILTVLLQVITIPEKESKCRANYK